MSDRLNEDISRLIPLEITPQQLTRLENLLELLKTIGSTEQLALVGSLAARPTETVAVAELAPLLTPKLKNNLPRHLRQLEKAGFIQIQEWQSARPGQEPEPHLVTFNPDYARQAQAMIAALRQVITLPKDDDPLVMDERTMTLRRFMPDGKIKAMPVQLKRQQYILAEVAKVFEPGIRYTEQQVDAILKQIYEYDHCTLRRYLVDFKFLNRAEGIYWKVNPVLEPV
jgi:predicted transcriptional regulator